MRKKETRLGYLMNLMEVSGKELAQAIDSDTTTISKLKKGQRRLSYKSKYTPLVVDYFMASGTIYQKERLMELLEQSGYKLDGNSDMKESLSSWLTEKIEMNGLNHKEDENLPIQTFFGVDGWKAAMESFWKEVRHLESGEEVYLGDLGDIVWGQVEKEYIDDIIEKMTEALDRGVKICIIDKVMGRYRPYEVLLRWLPVYFRKNISVLYLHQADEEIYCQSIYVAGNQVAYVGVRPGECSNQHFTMLMKNHDEIKVYQEMIQSIKQKCKNLFWTSSLPEATEMMEIISENLKPDQITYMMNELPSYRNMPETLLKQILTENSVDEEVQKICLKASEGRRKIRNRSNYRQIYNLDAIEKVLQQPSFVEYDLSQIVGKEIRITREHFKEQLQYIAETSFSETYKMILPSFRELHLNNGATSFVVQDDSILIAWDAKQYEQRIVSKELTLVGGVANYVGEVWKSIPPICKTDDWTKKQLSRMIKKEL